MNAGFFGDKTVLVTGGGGFLGSHVVRLVQDAGARVLSPSSTECDFRDESSCEGYFSAHLPQVVLHCAVDGGGIAYMRANPGSVLTHNVRLNTHVLAASHKHGVERFVGVSSACVYPRDVAVPMRETDIWSGYPEPSNAAYGISKRLMMEQGKAYHQQYGFSCAFPVPANLYGPGDDFDSNRSHVVAALIRRFVEARDAGVDEVVVWGSGKATREFLFVEDCAKAVLEIAASGVSPIPLNIGTGVETPIAVLAEHVAKACGFEGEVAWDVSKPDGQPRKTLDVSETHRQLKWRAEVALEQGLRRTVEWYCSR